MSKLINDTEAKKMYKKYGVKTVLEHGHKWYVMPSNPSNDMTYAVTIDMQTVLHFHQEKNLYQLMLSVIDMTWRDETAEPDILRAFEASAENLFGLNVRDYANAHASLLEDFLFMKYAGTRAPRMTDYDWATTQKHGTFIADKIKHLSADDEQELGSIIRFINDDMRPVLAEYNVPNMLLGDAKDILGINVESQLKAIN